MIEPESLLLQYRLNQFITIVKIQIVQIVQIEKMLQDITSNDGDFDVTVRFGMYIFQGELN